MVASSEHQALIVAPILARQHAILDKGITISFLRLC
jgi:hypothetical protein